MSDQTRRNAAPDYTNAALIMGFVNLFWSFLLISAKFGLPATLAVAFFLNYLITRFAHHRARMN